MGHQRQVLLPGRLHHALVRGGAQHATRARLRMQHLPQKHRGDDLRNAHGHHQLRGPNGRSIGQPDPLPDGNHCPGFLEALDVHRLHERLLAAAATMGALGH